MTTPALSVGDRVTYRNFSGTQVIGTIAEVGADRVHVVYPPGCGWENRWEHPSHLRRHKSSPKRSKT